MSSISAYVTGSPFGKALGGASAFSLGAGSTTTILLPGKSSDTTIPYNSTTGTFTIPADGKYLVSCLLTGSTTTTGYVAISVNGGSTETTSVAQGRVCQTNVNAGAVFQGSNIYSLTKGQTVNIVLTVSSAFTVQGNAQDTWWSVYKI